MLFRRKAEKQPPSGPLNREELERLKLETYCNKCRSLLFEANDLIESKNDDHLALIKHLEPHGKNLASAFEKVHKGVDNLDAGEVSALLRSVEGNGMTETLERTKELLERLYATSEELRRHLMKAAS